MERSRKLIETIKEQDIRPRPRWHFTLKNTVILVGFLVSVLLGALAFSIVLFAIQQTDFNLLSHLSHSRLELFLGLLPVFWLLLLIAMLLMSMYSLRHSPRGYKYPHWRQLFYSAAFSLLLGTLFFITGGAHRLEHAFEVNVSFYESINQKKIAFWMHPEAGQLAGQIDRVEAGVLQLTDFHGRRWRIRYDEDTFIPPVVLLEEGTWIKLVGSVQSDHEFAADEVRPWQGPGYQRMQEGRIPPRRK